MIKHFFLRGAIVAILFMVYVGIFLPHHAYLCC